MRLEFQTAGFVGLALALTASIALAQSGASGSGSAGSGSSAGDAGGATSGSPSPSGSGANTAPGATTQPGVSPGGALNPGGTATDAATGQTGPTQATTPRGLGSTPTDRTGSPTVPSTRDIGATPGATSGGAAGAPAGGPCNPMNRSAQADFGPTPNIVAGEGQRPSARGAGGSGRDRVVDPSTGIGAGGATDPRRNEC